MLATMFYGAPVFESLNDAVVEQPADVRFESVFRLPG